MTCFLNILVVALLVFDAVNFHFSFLLRLRIAIYVYDCSELTGVFCKDFCVIIMTACHEMIYDEFLINIECIILCLRNRDLRVDKLL